jgi:hypothetical protein
MEEYTALQPPAFVEKNPRGFALEFGNDDPVKEMISPTSINAIYHQLPKPLIMID